MDIMHKVYGLNNDITYDVNICVCNHHVSSLEYLSALSLLSNSSTLAKLIRCHVPRHLYSFIASVALFHNRTPCIKLLLNNWHQDRLDVPTPDLFKTWKLFCLKRHCTEFRNAMKSFHEGAATIIRHVAGWVSRSVVKPLRIIDLGDCFISDCLVSMLALTALTSFQKEITIKDRLGGRSFRKEELDSYRYTIRVHCILESGLCVYILLQLLKFSYRFHEGRLRLVITGLHVKPDAFGKEVFELIRLLNPEDLKVLNFERCCHWRTEDKFICVERFHYLQALDLSYIGMNATRQPEMLFRIGVLIKRLPHLKRFDISHSSLTDKLAHVLQEAPVTEDNCSYCSGRGKFRRSNELQYLSLSGCRLSEADVIHLSSSPYAAMLRYLNVNYTNFTIDSITQLLGACKNLKVLYMESCQFPQFAAPYIFDALVHMKSLRCLNVTDVNIAGKLVPLFGCSCQNLPQLRSVMIFSPHLEEELGVAAVAHYLPLESLNHCIGSLDCQECQCKVIL